DGYIGAPLKYIPEGVKQPEVVRLELTAEPRSPLRVLRVPCVLPQQSPRAAVIPCRGRTRTAGILPFGLRRQAIAGAIQLIWYDRHPFGILAHRVLSIACFQALLLAEPVAVGDGLIPCNGGLRALGIGARFRRPLETDLRVRPQEAPELLHGHLLGGHGKPP